MKKFSFSFLTILSVFSVFSQDKVSHDPDKTLDDYVSAGLRNSPLLKDYNNQKLANLVDSLRINAGYRPQVNGVSSNTYAPVIKGWGYDAAITNGTNIGEMVAVNQLLVGKGNKSNQQESIRLLNESLTISGKISEQDLKKVITAQYITAYGNWLQYQFNKEMIDLLYKEEPILKHLTGTGLYRQTDYLSFLVTTRQQELLVSQARMQYQEDFGTLNYLCGLQDTATVPLAAPAIDLVITPELETTVFYRQFIIDSMQLKNSDKQIDFSYKPRVNLYADAGYLTSFAEQAYKNFGTSFGISVIWPLYDGNQKKMKHDKNEIAEQTRRSYRDFYQKQYDQQIAQLSQQLQSAQQLINQAAEQIRYAGTLLEANRKLLEAGDVRMADYVLAIGNYLAARNVVTQNTVNKLQIINRINYWNRQ
jgi:outer membrane protein TolC